MTRDFETVAASGKAGTRSGSVGRRSFLIGLGAMTVSGCVATQGEVPVAAAKSVAPAPKPVVPAMYQAVPTERFPIPEVDIKKLDRRFWRTEIDYPTDEEPGTLIVDTPNKYLYHVKRNGRATRYGIGVGREGFAWSGRAIVAYKREWPRWTPPSDMIARQPELEQYRYGMEPGPDNPLGPRTLYIHQGNRDTLYRIHGNPDERSIGQAVSSGCVRLLPQDIIHLHAHVRNGSPLLVI